MKLMLDSATYIETSNPIDISIPLRNNDQNPLAWYVDPPRFEPVRTEHYVGSVKEGGSVNFRDIYFNPHGHGTHTECLGHITEEVYSINEYLNEYFYRATVVSILPKRVIQANGDIDFVITKEQVQGLKINGPALIVRTMPNDRTKMSRNYSSSNPPYFEVDCVDVLLKAGVDHLLVDVPSVDRESDNGELAFHHAFWEVPKNPNFKRTITELIFVPNIVRDGDYMLNLHVAPFHNDAAPSRPVLFELKELA